MTKQVCGKCGSELIRLGTGQLCQSCLLESGLRSALDPEGAMTIPVDSGQEGPSTKPGQARRPAVHEFGDFELLEEIARGGMGVVYKARQISLDRMVAVKMLLFGSLASPADVQRFRTEAAAAAGLHHPNIVAIHEVGFRDGQHFFAMDYVAGRSLAELLSDGPLPAQRAAHYVQIIAEAIQYAHQQGILHRDLKPSNVLVDENDQPKVTDFGLAKRLVSESTIDNRHSSLTLSGQLLGSPNYMAPEQAAADRGQVGKRSDVYSLGAILYHLLTGRPPFVASTIGETLQQVQTLEPISPTILNPHVPRDLKTICLKCLEKDPARRYQTAQELADELGRWLRGETILARPVSRPEKLWRWCRRKPLIASLGGTTVLLLLALAIGSPMAAYHIQRERNVAEGQLYAARMKLAHGTIKAGKIGRALQALLEQPPEFRGFEWRFLYRLCQTNESPNAVLATNASGFSAVDWSPDQRSLALGAVDGTVQLFDSRTRRPLKRWQAHEGVVNDLAFCPTDTTWLVTISGDDGWLKVFNTISGRVVFTTNGSTGLFPFVAFSPSGELLASSGPDNLSVNLWEFQAGAENQDPRLTLRANLPHFGPAAFSPDGHMLAVGPDYRSVNGVTLFDMSGRRVAILPEAHTDLIQAMAFSPDGRWLASGGADERVILWDLEQRKLLYSVTGDLINVMSVAFSTNGQSLYIGAWDANIRRWDFARPDDLVPLRGHSSGVDAIALSADGATLVSASRDGVARLWDLHATAPARQPLHAEFDTLLRSEDTAGPSPGAVGTYGIAVSPGGTRVVAVASTKLWLLDPTTGAPLATASAEQVFSLSNSVFSPTAAAAFYPDGETLAVGSAFGDLAFLDANSLRRLAAPRHLYESQLSHIAFGLGGRVVVTGGGVGKGVTISEFPAGAILTNLPAMGGLPIQPLAVSADGKLLAMCGPQRRVQVWDLVSRRLVASSPLKVRLPMALAFSPDGRWLAIPEEMGTIFLWDYRGRRPLRKLAGHAGSVVGLAFSPDGRTLASGSMDHTIKLWHPEIDQEVATLEGHTGWVWCLAFAERGNALFSGGHDGTLNVWRAASSAEIRR